MDVWGLVAVVMIAAKKGLPDPAIPVRIRFLDAASWRESLIANQTLGV